MVIDAAESDCALASAAAGAVVCEEESRCSLETLHQLQDLLRKENKGDCCRRRRRRQGQRAGVVGPFAQATVTKKKTDTDVEKLSKIDAAWKALSLSSFCLQRPIPDTLFQCPVSSTATTLLFWQSLPRPLQQALLQLEESSSSSLNHNYHQADVAWNEQHIDTLVEVPVSYLEQQGSGPETEDASNQKILTAAALNNTTKRRLGGNLTNKLSEYTRGVAGQCHPFQPGGAPVQQQQNTDMLNNHEAPDHDNQNVEDYYYSQAAIDRSRRVLALGNSAESWNEQTLLTAPPGVDFVVGLTLDDILSDSTKEEEERKQQQQVEEERKQQQQNISLLDPQFESLSSDLLLLQQQQQRNNSISVVAVDLFTKSYFDDDSLFGSSTDESSTDESSTDESSANESGSDRGEDDEDDNPAAEEDDDDAPPVASAAQLVVSSVVASSSDKEDDKAKEEEKGQGAGEDDILADDEAVDALLTEFETTTSPPSQAPFLKNKKKNKKDGIDNDDDIENSMNPLHLAIQHSNTAANTASNNNRKVWASEKLLPISDFQALIPNPAMVFPFTLDDFQQQAVARLERSESVFVAAHTSAGKTVVAEYAVALAKQRSTRCVYTSPIKALSNQKFRDFSLKFGSETVGLVTGDLQVNVDDSTCLIMTTEILRSMLYRGADLIRDIEWVIFDEVHYVNDTERGVVWEEVIIMLPSYVNLIFLSATTPNTFEFSDWIGRTKRKVVHVIKTNYRPVPLSHHLWAGSKLNKIMEGNGGFLEIGYKEAQDALIPQSVKDAKNNKNKGGGDAKGRPVVSRPTGSKQMTWQVQGSKANWVSLVRFLDREFLTPTVVFSFSKKKCEEIANMLRSLDLNTAKERSAVQGFALQTVARLSQNDAKLPQVLMICEMVQRGIGVHHGGLLPILKEMVEILFSRNLIKILFATETFAMGVNMPARAVVFNSIRKHDGLQFRVLEPGEYTQMAGRAGRRGLDKVGTVILCCFGEEPPPVQILRNMLTGSSTILQSQFRLTYNMILNLLRVEEMSVEAMISRSFSEFATQRALTANDYPQLLAKGVKTLAKLEERLQMDAAARMGAGDLEDYFSVCRQLLSQNKMILSYIQTVEFTFADVFPIGRIVLVTAARQYGLVRAPAVVLKAEDATATPGGGAIAGTASSGNSTAAKLVCLLLLPTSYIKPEEHESQASSSKPKKGQIGYIGTCMNREYAIRVIELDQILLVTTTKRKIDAKAILMEASSSSSMRGFGGAGFGRSSNSRDAAALNPFAGMKILGKKEVTNEASTGVGKANADKSTDDAVNALIAAETAELRGSGVEMMSLKTFLKRGSEAVYFRQECDATEELVARMRSYESHLHPKLEKYYGDVERKEALSEKVATLKHLLSNESLQLFPDFLQRKAVLRTLGYVDENETVCVKGRVACEVNTCESLVVTEMVFEGLLNDLEPEEIAAVLSSLVFQDKKTEEEFDAEMPARLVMCCEQMKVVATNLGQLQKEQGLEIDPGEYCDGALKFGLVHVVYEWALGVPFKDICELTDVQEGSIVRTITRLDELCREVRNCARVVGNPTLYRKMEAASTAIKRDIVFASSLYVS